MLEKSFIEDLRKEFNMPNATDEEVEKTWDKDIDERCRNIISSYRTGWTNPISGKNVIDPRIKKETTDEEIAVMIIDDYRKMLENWHYELADDRSESHL